MRKLASLCLFTLTCYSASTHAQAPAAPSAEPGESPAPALEVVVKKKTAGQRAEESAQAASVVDLSDARARSADLGDVLSRVPGVTVRRAGGLGSPGALSLQGFTGDQVRFFLDGVPLELSGFPFGFANVPLGFVEHVVIHRGVVPIAYGADALGGAIDLVSGDDLRRRAAQASYQGGSFGTHRLALTARDFYARPRLFVRAGLFFDRADNDYAVDVENPDQNGRQVPVRVPRFHDGYAAEGGHAELGTVSQPYADVLRVRAFITRFERELQHNATMTVPYGEAEFERFSWGTQLRYQMRFGERLRLDATAGYTENRTRFRDLSRCRYDWYGRCVASIPGGEVLSPRTNAYIEQDAAYLRAQLSYRASDDHTARLSVAPTFSTQRGENRALDAEKYDPLRARRQLLGGLTGLEHEGQYFADVLSSTAFVKLYGQQLSAEEALPNGNLRDVDRTLIRPGGGGGLRVRVLPGFMVKSSYEYATRLPTAEELFGDGVLTIANFHLTPELSHNANLTLIYEHESSLGSLHVTADGFARETSDLIIRVGDDYFEYANVLSARTLGVEGSLEATTLSDHLSVQGNGTFQDIRNTSSDGEFARYEGQRIPNRPYAMANGAVTLRARGVAVPNDLLELTWETHYVASFLRGWSSNGGSDQHLEIPSQVTHGVSLTHLTHGKPLTVQSTIEVLNVTNATVFDYYGVQRPGRSAFFKLTLTL